MGHGQSEQERQIQAGEEVPYWKAGNVSSNCFHLPSEIGSTVVCFFKCLLA